MAENLEVALVSYLCPICGNVAQEGIIMNSLLDEKTASEVQKLHGKAVGFANHACSKCEKYKDEVVYFVSIDPDKSSKDNVYRTGQIAGAKKTSELAKRCTKYKKVLGDGSEFCFVTEAAGEKLGLWNITLVR